MDFSSVKSSSFFHKKVWKFFLEKQISLEQVFCKQSYSLWFTFPGLMEMTKVLNCPQSLGSKITVAFGVFDRYTLLWCFLPPWCIKIFDCSVRISAKTLLTKWNSFLDISLFFIYSYWYLPLKEWHTTCKKEKKNPKNTKEIPQWSFLLLLFVHKKT